MLHLLVLVSTSSTSFAQLSRGFIGHGWATLRVASLSRTEKANKNERTLTYHLFSSRLQEGVLSCRIKINQPQQDLSRSAAAGSSPQSSPKQIGITAGNMNSHITNGSTRRQDKLADAIQSMANLNSTMEFDSPIDPDAQATVTDFLDFTEYLPADMKRSCTLIADLDLTESRASAGVHDLTKVWGKPQDVPLDKKPDLVLLRAKISQTMGEAVRARTLSHTEAQRMSHNVEQHYNRAKNILAKLQAMAENYPPSRDPSPAPQKSISPVATRAPMLKLRLDANREGHGGQRVRKHRAPRITVPGEVLAPYELDYESYGSESENWESDELQHISPRRTPARSTGPSTGRIKLKIPNRSLSVAPKPASRQPRPAGAMGTNVHSAVAGISTTNALAMLKPPPPDAKNGSDDLPWLQLTDWELGMLRKRMKKNAVWSPSDTMIARELKVRGRGIEAYRAAKKEADASGQPLDTPIPPQLLGQTVHAEGAISVEAVRGDQEVPTVNRGMKLNEAKKLKKENQQKELAQAAEEAAEAVRKMNMSAEAMKDIFNPKPSDGKSPAKPSRTPARKRKRESTAPETTDMDRSVNGESLTAKSDKADRPPAKRTKTETPIPCPQPIATKDSKTATPSSTIDVPVNIRATSSVSDAVTETTNNSLAVPVSSPAKSSTPILPPGRNHRSVRADEKKEPMKEIKKEPTKVDISVTTRTSRSSNMAKTPTPAPETLPALPAKRPTSSRSKAASTEPPNFASSTTTTLDRPRRSSTARNTPAPSTTTEPRQANKRTKRPAPGVVTTSNEGSAAVSVGKRSSATRKKAGAKNKKKDGVEESAAPEVYEEFDDEGNLIDPNEPRYCLCNRVSFGIMIGCENNEVSLKFPGRLDIRSVIFANDMKCEKEWFHLECVGLTEIPPRTTKWYCPDCRKKLGLGERGEVTARGKKK